MEVDVERLHKKLSEKYQLPEERHYDMFEIRRNGELYYKGVDKPLTYNKGRLKTVGKIKKIVGKNRLRALGLGITKGEVTHQQTIALDKADEQMPSTSDIAKADGI